MITLYLLAVFFVFYTDRTNPLYSIFLMTFQVNTPKLTAKTKGQKITFELMVKVGQLRHSCLRFQVIIKKEKKNPANHAEGGKMWLCCKTLKC